MNKETLGTLYGPSNKQWQAWFSEFNQLLRADTPVLEALQITHEMLDGQTGSRALADCLQLALARLQQGQTLETVFCEQAVSVPREILLALTCAHRTGRLREVCMEHERRWRLRTLARQQLLKSMIYPAVVFLTAIGCWWILAHLTHTPDQSPSEVSHFHWLGADGLLAGGFIVFLVAWPLAFRDALRPVNVRHKKLKLKGWSPTRAWQISEHFFELEQELRAGHDLLMCLRRRSLRTKARSSRLLKQLNLMFARLHQAIESGHSLSEAMAITGAPEFMRRQASLSEQTGDLAQPFRMASQIFEFEAQRRQHRLHSILGPLTLALSAATLLVAYQTTVAPLYSNLGVL